MRRIRTIPKAWAAVFALALMVSLSLALGYAGSAQTADAALWPVDATEARNLLDFFLIEKAFYEMEYELMNRPTWLHVPVEGTLRILAHHGVVPA